MTKRYDPKTTPWEVDDEGFPQESDRRDKFEHGQGDGEEGLGAPDERTGGGRHQFLDG